jgi:endonuclease YncB( thermonuclease family)
MVLSGWAVAYRKYSLDYATDKEHAHLAKVGIWSGTFDMPWPEQSQKQKR